eukprot:2522592-Lingulodinium_polyedra.AAC.1
MVRGARPPARPPVAVLVWFLPGGVFSVMYISRSIAANGGATTCNGREAGHSHKSSAAGAQP